MEVLFHRNFKKQYTKLPHKTQQQFLDRLALLQKAQGAHVLNVHRLRGEFRMYTSMNVTSDVRALFVKQGESIIFEKIGTHSELYK